MIINLYKILFLTLRNIILKYKIENLTKIILLFCPVRRIIDLYEMCFLVKKTNLTKQDHLPRLFGPAQIKKTEYL